MGEYTTHHQLKENPLDPSNQNLRLLIIFDGLDELALQGKLAKEAAQDFVGEVKRQVELFNSQNTRLQVLITGREVTVQESFRNNLEQILYVLPYFIENQNRQREQGEVYIDPDQKLAIDQRDN